MAICESLLLALTDTRVLSVSEANGVLTDAAAAKRAAPDSPDNADQSAAADIIEQIIFDHAAFRTSAAGD